jgi:gas vesicle protein
LDEIKTRLRACVPLAHSHSFISKQLSKTYSHNNLGISIARLDRVKEVNKRMNKALLIGAGVGAAAMYLLDPDRGKRRRALVRDKFALATRETRECMEVTRRDLRNRTLGTLKAIQSRLSSEQPDDSVLVERVRSKVGRVVSHPSAIQVTAQDGNITLAGPILASEAPHLVTCASWVPGVKDVTNNLEVHEEAGNHPALQGGHERHGSRFPLFQENWSPTARLLAGAAGASLMAYCGVRRNALGTGLGTAGFLLTTRAITNTGFSHLASEASKQLHLGGSSTSEIQPTA